MCRIGIDARMLGPRPKGIGRYIWELCKGLDKALPEAAFVLYSRVPTGLPRISSRWTERVDSSRGAIKIPNTLWGVTRVGFLSQRDHLDGFWGGTGLIPLIGLRTRSILTVHDLVYRIQPHTTSAKAKWAARLFFQASVKKADSIVCNSNGTSRRLESFLGRPADAVVRPGVSTTFRKLPIGKIARALSAMEIRCPYILAVGTWEPRKGLQHLIPAFLSLSKETALKEHTLVVVGERGWKDGLITNLIEAAGEKVRALGFVDDESLAALYGGTDALIFPSSYEGFGIPILEARACGTRVVASDLPELREAGGDDTIYVPPTEQGIKLGILRALESDCPKPLPARMCGWSESAAIFANVLRGLASLNSAYRPQPRGAFPNYSTPTDTNR
jgi:glycosyltransferase involved in cell wall biosynthesis